MTPISRSPIKGPRIAIVHDWLTAFGGAERVLIRLCKIFPQAEIFTLFSQNPVLRQALASHVIHTSFLARLPGIDRNYRRLASLMPIAIEQFRFDQFDLVISSSWAFAHAVDTPTLTPHLSYIHSPMRWAWDMRKEYMDRADLRGPMRWLIERELGRLRRWDRQSAQKHQHLIANSQFIAQRIRNCWQKNSDVIYPPVQLPPTSISKISHGAYVSVSRLVKYKRVDLWVRAFRYLPDRRLIVVGTGPELEHLKSVASPNVEFTGWLPDEKAIELMSGARGFLQASKEDFGISVVEAQGCGTPVLAFREGGASETVLDPEHARPTGLLFDSLDPELVAQHVLEFERHQFSPDDCRLQAERFSPEIFDAAILEKTVKISPNLNLKPRATE